MKKTDWKQVTLYLHPETLKQLDELAVRREATTRTRTTRVDLVREAIELLLKAEERS